MELAFEAQLAREESYFRHRLLKEDLARLIRLDALSREAADFDTFVAAGIRIGWTRDDMRTSELSIPIKAFLGAIWTGVR